MTALARQPVVAFSANFPSVITPGGGIEHLQLALGAASMHTWSWDIRTGRVTWSSGIAALVGMKPDEFGETFDAYQKVLHPDDAPAVLAAVRHAVDDPHATYDVEHRVCMPGGEIRWLACRGCVVRSESGEPLTMLGIVWDMTARRSAVARIESTEAALRLSEQRLLRADRMASLGRLAAGVAHEINNPLAYIALNHEIVASNLARLPDDPTVLAIRQALEVAREGTERVRRIVRELATFGRRDDEGLSTVDVHAVLDGAFAIAENEIRHRARFTRSYTARAVVRANDSRLGQVFVNLLVNAADAIEEGSVEDNEIRVDTSVFHDRVVIAIRDTGVGIKAKEKDRLFDPFFTTKASGVGTGLGLWICHNIVTSIGGEITVENNPGGRGATVRVVLCAASDTDAATIPPPTTLAPTSRRARILVIDDEPSIGEALADLLASHDVTVATGGREGRELGATGDFDCVLCDVMMPDLSGPEVYEAFQRDGLGLEQRMVFMTAHAFVPRARAFLASVPNRCLTKPFGVSEIENAVANVLAAVDALPTAQPLSRRHA
ncbi:MAG: sensor histidine kinase [Myxococcaceae bacterium]|nr:sensor histidine kinase [Myxococcaceae bacterium]